MARTWSHGDVVRNFRIDLFGAICAGTYIAVLVAFMPVVVRRMGGSPFDVALVVAAPFIGHLLSPLFIYLLSGLRPAGVVAGTIVISRVVFIVGMLVATTPLMLGVTVLATWIIGIANIAAYTTLMAAMYPDGERAQAMAKVRMGAAVAGIASAAVAGVLIDVAPATLVFAAVAIVSLPGALAFFWIRDTGHDLPGPRRSVVAVWREVSADRRYGRLLLAMTVFGFGNLMNFAVIPILLVDHFDAPNAFVGGMAALQAATSIVAYLVWGRLIDRGSSLRLSSYNQALLLLVPVGYLLAPSVWFLLPLAVVTGAVNAGFDITFHTNIVQVAPRGKVMEYATAQSFVLGIRGTVAPFAASALMLLIEPRMVLAVGVAFMLTGLALLYRVVREFASAAPVEPVAAVTTEPAAGS